MFIPFVYASAAALIFFGLAVASFGILEPLIFEATLRGRVWRLLTAGLPLATLIARKDTFGPADAAWRPPERDPVRLALTFLALDCLGCLVCFGGFGWSDLTLLPTQ